MKKKIRRPLMVVVVLAFVGALGAILSACGSGDHSMGDSTAASGERTVDQAFVAEMIPHHEMAIEMAEMAEMDGEHPEVTKLAENIIESQSSEVEAMKPIAEEVGAEEGSGGHDMEGMSEMDMGDEGGSSMSEDADVLGLSMDEMGMSMKMSDLEGAEPFDRAFIDMMIPHHEGAVAMAEAQIDRGENEELTKLAESIVSAQEKEIKEMREWQAEWYGSSDSEMPSMEGEG